MESFQRGRSPSVQRIDISRSRSPSPHPAMFDQAPGNISNTNISGANTNVNSSHGNNHNHNSLGAVDPSLLFTDSHSASSHTSPPQFDGSAFPPAELNIHQSQQGLNFAQSQPQSHTQAYQQAALQHLRPSNPSFDQLEGLNPSFDFGANNQFDTSFPVDPLLLDPQQDLGIVGNNEKFDMAMMHQQSAEAPHLLQPQPRHASISSMHSAGSNFEDSLVQSYQQLSGGLNPASAAFAQQGNQDWSSYQHRRTPSAHSDISSAHHSPYLGSNDSFDPMSHHSPMLNGAQDPYLLPEFTRFSLSDGRRQPGMQQISPRHSPQPSPYLAAQQLSLPVVPENMGLGLNGNHYGHEQYNPQEPFPSIETHMSPPPAIMVDFAPTHDEFPGHLTAENGEILQLSDQSGRVNRNNSRPRAISAPYFIPNSSRGTSPGRGRSPSLGLVVPPNRMRSSSPSVTNGISKPNSRRSSSPAIPADRTRAIALIASESSVGSSPEPGEDGSNLPPNKRTQKHPSTFHCNLCSKSFTRAYNLRSHLRTHTDERPFVCTVCGKAFARQHDRKRHESLHSGEKKFICKGTLGSGHPWGCGRGFARADALGRHFRSEAGRACIKPLLDEEARERQLAAMDQQQQDMLNQQNGLQMQPQMANVGHAGGSNMDPNMIPLPSVLVQMYPALADMWYSMPPGINEGDADLDLSGMEDSDLENDGMRRGSYDASSGGEIWDEEDGTGMSMGMQGHMGMGMPLQQQGQVNGMASSYGNGWA